jgi:hypothetical protein
VYEVDNPESGFRIGPKLTGIWLGWQIMWSICNALPDSHFLLLEHDAVLCPDFKERLNAAWRDVPSDFDWLFLGSCCAKGHPTRHIAGEVFEVKYPQCNHATILAKKAVPKILATQRKLYGPQDCTLIFHTFPALKVYTVLPRMAEQVGTFLSP